MTPSEWLAGLVRQSFFKGCRIEVINNGINLNDFKPTTGTIIDKLQIGDRKVILGVSSTWVKSKGLNDFIQLASLLPKTYVIVLVGLTKQQKEELPNTIIGIERTDSVKELAELYTVASVFVNPTYEDNYPTTNLEALACGTPVLTYRTGGSVEAAGSEYGKIVDQGNVNQLAEYIVSRKWESVTSEMCREKAKEFDENIKFNEYVELYIKKEYERWLANATADADVVAELKTLDDAKIEDAFYRDLAFGTGGLRGVIGAGTNRMNVYTVAKASQGLADYLKKNFETPSVAIGYDSRIKSDVFAKVAAGVFAANGVKVNIWPVLMPVPTVSFATRYLHTSAGVMVTASHNPSKYNGYKVYGADGCQITTEAAAEILAEIEKLDIFADVKTGDFEAGVANGSIQYIPDEVYTAFVEQVKSQSVLFGEEVNKNVAIVYSPLNGTGLKPVTRTLKEMGYTNITVVKEQEQPDGNFPTCPYPNPEIKEAMALGMEYAKKCNADLLLATDPDCDRVGIAVKNKAGEYELLTGNQTGMLLLDYICSQRVKHGKMPVDPVMVKTIVTMDMGKQIATHYGLRTINVLTGFKFIGEQIGKLEKQGKADSYVFGFEESYGYLTGSYVRDKDGVDGAYMICEMFSYYATKGISLLDKLEELYKTYGYCLNTLHSYEFDGSAGFAKMQNIMQAFRGDIKAFGGKKVVKLLDYAPGLDGLPKSDVLKFLLEDNCSIVVRPSGTEPKLKIYISVSAENKEAAEKVEAEICKSAEEYLK